MIALATSNETLVDALAQEQAAEAKDDLKRVRVALRRQERPVPKSPWNAWTNPRIGPMQPSLSNPKPDGLEVWLKERAREALERKQAPRGWR